MTYLDNAATTLQKPPQVFAAMQQALRFYANPGRSGHAPAMRAAKAVFESRQLAGQLFEIQPENVCFTLNATHALNIAIRTLVQKGSRVVISGFEHNAVTRPLFAIGAQSVVAGTSLLDPEENLRAFEREITPDTAAVIVNHVSNVFGTVQPLAEIAKLCTKKNVPLIVDASQSAGTLDISLQKLNAAFIALPGHKGLYGPQGTGLLLCGRTPQPLLFGGTGSNSTEQDMPPFLPDRVEAGTLNVPGICGLCEGLRYVLAQTPQTIAVHERTLCRQLSYGLQQQKKVQLFGNGNGSVLSFLISGMDCEETAQRLAKKGIAVRAGLHCAPLAHCSGGTSESGTVRASFSAFTTQADTERLLREVENLCKLRSAYK